MQGDLTTLARVKEWLAPGGGTLSETGDALLRRLITSGSVFMMNYLNRKTLAVVDCDHRFDSGGRDFIMLRSWPVVSVSSVEFGGYTLTEEATGNPPATGFIVSDPPQSGGTQRLQVLQHVFPRGRGTVRVQYRAGFQIEDEAHVIPATPHQITTNQVSLGVISVTTAAGAALTEVASSPAAGQYSVSDEGVLTFAAADAGSTVLVTYSYVPADIEQALIEMIGERWKQRDRIGVSAKTLPNGESVTFFNRDLSEHSKTALQSYKRVTMS